MRIAVVSTVRAPIYQIQEFVSHYSAVGVARIYLYLDDPTGDQVSTIRSLAPGMLEVVECDPRYWSEIHQADRPKFVETRQRLNTTHALTVARLEQIDWILHVDVDEFILAKEGLPRLLGRLATKGVDYVRMPVREVVTSAAGPRGTLQVKRHALPEVSLGDRAYSLGFRLANLLFHLYSRVVFKVFGTWLRLPGLDKGYHRFFNGHYLGKSISRVMPDLGMLGLHLPRYNTEKFRRVHVSSRCVMLHFESPSFEAWREKWNRRTEGQGAAGGLDWRQMEVHARFMDCEGDVDRQRTLYLALYHMNDTQMRNLRLFGLIARSDDPRGSR